MFKMQGYIPRKHESELIRSLEDYPVVAVIGPRQCGKSTIAREVLGQIGAPFIYLDLEKDSDLNKLGEAEFFFRNNQKKLICIDEIQKKPDLFPLIRSIVDESASNGQFLILGSASPELLKQTSETLAGRIHYLELTPFLINEIDDQGLWIKGGFPRSLLSTSDDVSFAWRENFIKTFLERDIPQFGINIPAPQLRRFWTMCAHSAGQILNKSKLGESLGISHTTVQRYLDILESTFMIRILSPYFGNLKKRLIKSPKIYFRDTGILHTILNILDLNELMGHPAFGVSWESYALENIVSSTRRWQPSFFRSSSGSEIDLILERGIRRLAIEFKASMSPKYSKALLPLIDELEIEKTWIVAPVTETYPLNRRIIVSSVKSVIEEINKI